MKFGSFFLPGPTEVRREVLEAMLKPMISHRSPQFAQLFASIQSRLKRVFKTEQSVLISASSATGMMEAGIRCARQGPVLALVNGAFSERFAQIGEACGRKVDRYSVEWGMIHDLDQVEQHLKTRKYAVVTVVHSETSTGALNRIREIAQIARQNNVVCLVDSVSGMGGVEVYPDEWQLDYILTGSQKALALPAGLAFAVPSREFLDEAKALPGKGVYFDLNEFARHAKSNFAPNTPALSLYYALDKQLDDILAETVEGRWRRHREMAETTEMWAEKIGREVDPEIRILAREGARSPTVSTISLPKGLSSSSVAEHMMPLGFSIGLGYGKLRDTSIRIGHMGDHTTDELINCLDACERVIRELVLK